MCTAEHRVRLSVGQPAGLAKERVDRRHERNRERLSGSRIEKPVERTHRRTIAAVAMVGGLVGCLGYHGYRID